MTAEDTVLQEQVHRILLLRIFLRNNIMPFNEAQQRAYDEVYAPFNEAQQRVYDEMMAGLPALGHDDDEDLPDLEAVE